MITLDQQHRARKNKRGISLLVAVVVIGIVTFIAASVSSMSFHQLQLTSIGENSQYAFYAADSGIECVLYWDLLHDAFPTPGDTESEMNSKVDQIVCNNMSGTDLAPAGEGDIKIEVQSDRVITTFQIPNLLDDPRACAHEIIVTETEVGGRITTTIESRAKSDDCDASGGRVVERAVRVTY